MNPSWPNDRIHDIQEKKQASGLQMFPTFVAQSLSISKLHHHQQLTIVKSKKTYMLVGGFNFQPLQKILVNGKDYP